MVSASCRWICYEISGKICSFHSNATYTLKMLHGMIRKGLHCKNIPVHVYAYLDSQINTQVRIWKVIFCLHCLPDISGYRLTFQPILANECPNGNSIVQMAWGTSEKNWITPTRAGKTWFSVCPSGSCWWVWSMAQHPGGGRWWALWASNYSAWSASLVHDCRQERHYCWHIFHLSFV